MWLKNLVARYGAIVLILLATAIGAILGVTVTLTLSIRQSGLHAISATLMVVAALLCLAYCWTVCKKAVQESSKGSTFIAMIILTAIGVLSALLFAGTAAVVLLISPLR